MSGPTPEEGHDPANVTSDGSVESRVSAATTVEARASDAQEQLAKAQRARKRTLGAIGITVFAGALVLLGTTVGVIFSFKMADSQQKNTALRARHDFVRTLREKVYAQMTLDEQKLQGADNRLRSFALTTTEISAAAQATALGTLLASRGALLERVHADADNIVIVGTTATAKDAAEVFSHERSLTAFQAGTDAANPENKDVQIANTQLQAFDKIESAVGKSIDSSYAQFLNDAHLDMGT